jgi:hypothetical protein
MPEKWPDSVVRRLAEPFAAGEVKFKPQKVSGNKALAMAYIDARCVMERLDEVFGVEGWQDKYEVLADGSVVCALTVSYGADSVRKMDVGSPSEQPDEHDRLKAAFSDALKRAAVKFGIGRYLYRLKAQWVDYDSQKRQFVREPALPGSAPAPALPARGAKAAPAKAPARQLPKDGRELCDRLMARDGELAKAGLCRATALLAYVAEKGRAAGYPKDMIAWKSEQIAAAAKFAKEAEAEFRAAKEVPA